MKTKKCILFISLILISYLYSYGYQDKTGTISSQDIWSDTIHVIGDITIIQGGDVIINPGTYIEFEGYFFIKLTDTGKITAIGNNNDSIRFIPFNHQTGWSGIKFQTMSTLADSSIFDFCSFQYGKGAFSIRNFNKIRFSNCNFSNNRPDASTDGGSIHCYYTTIIIKNCTFRYNYGGFGGALYFIASHANIINSRFTENTAYFEGGGIFSDTSYLNLNNCLIDSNILSGTGASAGLCSRESEVTLTNCKFLNNKNNAIYSFYSGKLKLDNTLVANNEGSDGGGLNCVGIDLIILNSTIVNNKAGVGDKAGGIYCYYCPVQIYNSIIWNNAGVYNDFYYEYLSPQINNCDIQDGNALNLPDSEYVNNISLNPNFVNPSANIGVSNDAIQSDWSLMSCSPCINKGDSNLLDSIPSVDLNNNPRIYNDTIDIGAIEYQGNQTPGENIKIIYIKENGTGDGSSWSNAMGNIEDAIETPLGCYDRIEIWVASGTYYPLATGQAYTREASFKLKDFVGIYGGFIGNETDLNMRNWKLNPTILCGDIGISNDNTDNAYHVVTAEYTGNTAILDGFIITKGSAAYTTFTFSDGGGIWCSYAHPTLNNLTIKNNIASFDGGGIYLNYSHPQITNSFIYNNNSDDRGGGIYMNHSNAYLINTQVINNNIPYGFDGGGIALSNSNPYIINSIIANNNAPKGGGMYSSYNSSPIIINSLFANNTANEGAGIYSISESYPVIYNSIFWNNMNEDGIDNFGKTYDAADTLYTVISSLVQGGNIYNFPASHYVNNINVFPRFTYPSVITGLDDNVMNADWSLLPCSPCINAGTNVFFPDTIDYDMAINSRIYNTTIDIGPYEYQGNPSGTQPKKIIYVKPNGNGVGTSWIDAVGDLQQAIDLSYGCFDATEIWVSAGVYFPDTIGLGDTRQASFSIRNNTNLYGGFAGDETSISQRDWNTNNSILNGNIGSSSVSTDNCNHVVTVINQDSTVVLDGFAIMNGHFNDFNGGGGGIYSINSTLTLRNLIFKNNVSAHSGGGIYSIGSEINMENSLLDSNRSSSGGTISLQSSEMEISKCKIINNSGSYSGGLYLQNTRGNIINCQISNNYGGNAGAIYSNQSNYSVINSTLANNLGGPDGIYTNDTLFILNSILWDTGYGGNIAQIYFTDENLLRIENCDIKNGENLNLPTTNYINNLDINPNFKNPNTLVGNFSNAELSDWSLSSCSPCINMGLNDPAYVTSAFDIDSNPRIFNNETIDLGAYEYQGDIKCFYIKFIITDTCGPGIGYEVSFDWNTYKTTDSLGQCQFNNYSYGDKLEYRIMYNYMEIFSDSITFLENDTIIYFFNNSINDYSSDTEWLIYPNPVKDKITIEISKKINNCNLFVYNIKGQEINRYQINDNKSQIDLSNLTPGIYFLKLVTDKTTQVRKIILNSSR